MKPWWERWPRRLEWELKAFSDAGLKFERDEQEFARGRVVLRGSAPISSGEHEELIVVYPDTFPNTRFTIFAPGLKLPRHQEPFQGNLCVFPRDSRYWRPQTTAAEIVVKDVPRLVGLVRKGGDALRAAEDPQGEPFSTYFGYLSTGGVIIPEQILTIPKNVIRGTYTLRFKGPTDWIQIAGSTKQPKAIGSALLLDVRNDKGQVLAKASPALEAVFRGIEYKGHWARLTVPRDAPSVQGFFDNLRRALPKGATDNGSLRLGLGHYEIPAAVFSEEIGLGKQGDSWVFFLLGQIERSDNWQSNLLRGVPFGPNLLSERIPELKAIRKKKVVIIGLGTLGAPLAAHMCKAQVGSLVLADTDYVDPNTGVRWFSELDGAGADKTLALKKRLATDYPFTQIEEFRLRIGDAPRTWDADSSETRILEKMLTGADLIIDATAEENVSNALYAIAREAGLPLLSAFSIDGLGGVVARLREGETGCLHCLALAVDRGNIAWPIGAADQNATRVQPRGCADPTFIGTSVDLEPLVTQAASLALGTLCRGTTGGYSELKESDVFVLQLRNPDRSLKLPEWKAFRLPKDSQCPLCSGLEQSSVEAPAN